MSQLTFNGQRLQFPSSGVLEYFPPFELLTADFIGDQIDLIFRLPIGKSMTIDWGNGNTENINGLGESNITVTSNYSIDGNYKVTILKDYLYMTRLGCSNEDVSGDISSWSALTNLTYLYCYSTDLSGNISSWSALTSLTYLNCATTSVSGNISSWSALTSLTYLNTSNTSVSGNISSWSALTNLITLHCSTTSVSGDISSWSTLTNLTYLFCSNNSITFDSSTAWTNHDHDIYLSDCIMTSTMVDNMLIAFDGGSFTNETIDIGGTNAIRTSASDTSYNNLVSAGNTVTVNS